MPQQLWYSTAAHGDGAGTTLEVLGPPGSCMSRSSGVHPFQAAALSRLGSQSSRRIDGSSPENNSMGGAFPCRRRLSVASLCGMVRALPEEGGRKAVGLLPEGWRVANRVVPLPNTVGGTEPTSVASSRGPLLVS